MVDADPLRLAFLEQNDLGNAERGQAIAGGRLKWVEDSEYWVWFDGRRFDAERGGIEAQRLAHRVIRHIRDEARAVQVLIDAEDVDLLRTYRGSKADLDKVKTLPGQLHKHALKSGSAGMTGGMLRQLRGLEGISCLSADFDRDPLAFNCLNGTLRFVRKGEKWEVAHSPHDPTDMLMQVADAVFDPDAKPDFWSERLDLLHPDKEQLRALKLLYGSILTGFTDDQAFYVHQGRGNDGKSATHRALGQLVGDYFRHAGVKTFLQGADRGGAEHRSDLVRLAGDVRFVCCDEPKERSTWDGETIKQVTGSLITARGSGAKDEITYEPHFKLCAECNNIPRPPSDDKGFRRRFRLFQWRVSLPAAGEPGHVSMNEVLERLKAERSGILNWLIEGALEWLVSRHVPEPVSMQSVLKDYWAASSVLLDWMDGRCDVNDPDVLTYASALYSDFKQFCTDRGDEKIMSQTAFGTKLRDKHFISRPDNKGLVMRKGIRLLSEGERNDRFARAAALDAGTGAVAEPSGQVDPGDDLENYP